MKELEDLREEKISGERNHFERIVIVVVVALLIGFLAGFLSHDHLVQFTSDHLDWKIW
ncbi:MAG: hypothetical protein ABSD46_00450 [Bacteroidota bacterium]